MCHSGTLVMMSGLLTSSQFRMVQRVKKVCDHPHSVTSTHDLISVDLHGVIALPPMVSQQNQQGKFNHNCTACLNTIKFLCDVLRISVDEKVVTSGNQQALALIADKHEKENVWHKKGCRDSEFSSTNKRSELPAEVEVTTAVPELQNHCTRK